MPKLLRAAVTGIGSHVPQRVLTNADFERMVDTSDEWIIQRTGIRERHVVSNGETTATLSVEAARKALADANLTVDQIDLILLATITPEMILPATACFVQEALGAQDVPCMDIVAACSGFLYALTVGCQFIQSGTHRRVLVIGADVLSRITDYTDRGSCILFGDAAGAVVLEATEEPDRGVLYNVLRANGSGWDFINAPGGGSRQPASEQTLRDRLHFIKMRGRDVYKFAVEKMQWLMGDCLNACNLTPDQIDMIVPHQVNLRILQSAAEKYDFPMEKVFINIDRYGNTSAASVPLALDDAKRMGKIAPGSTVLMVAFGAGLTWAGSVLKL